MSRLIRRPIRGLGLLVLFLINVLLVVPCGWAQTTLGAVSGTVRDPSGAVIPNASVVLTNTATGIVADTKSNEVGFYLFPSVAPGSYTLSVQSAGMQKFEGAFTIRGAERLVIDAPLTPGAIATAVDVKDVTPLVATDNPTVSATLERERINQLLEPIPRCGTPTAGWITGSRTRTRFTPRSSTR